MRNRGAVELARKGLPYREIAIRCGVSVVAAGYWCRGTKKPAPPKRQLLRDWLNIDPEWWDAPPESQASQDGTPPPQTDASALRRLARAKLFEAANLLARSFEHTEDPRDALAQEIVRATHHALAPVGGDARVLNAMAGRAKIDHLVVGRLKRAAGQAKEPPAVERGRGRAFRIDTERASVEHRLEEALPRTTKAFKENWCDGVSADDGCRNVAETALMILASHQAHGRKLCRRWVVADPRQSHGSPKFRADLAALERRLHTLTLDEPDALGRAFVFSLYRLLELGVPFQSSDRKLRRSVKE